MNYKELKCRVMRGHVMKHYLITSIEEFDDDRGRPANRMLKTIDRKCMECGHLATEVIRTNT